MSFLKRMFGKEAVATKETVEAQLSADAAENSKDIELNETKTLKFESAGDEAFSVCFEPLCEIFEVKSDHVLSVPIVGDINSLSISMRDGEITVWETGEVLNTSEAKLESGESIRKAARMKYDRIKKKSYGKEDEKFHVALRSQN